MLETTWWGAHTLLWRLWSEATNRMLLLHFQHHMKGDTPVLKERVAPFKPLLNILCIFLSYAFDNITQISFWPFRIQRVGAQTFLSMLHINWSLSMTRWFSSHWHFSSVFLYLISICSLPINERWKGKHPSHSLIIYFWLGDVIFLLHISVTCWQINLKH